MKNRERIVNALNFKPVDRVPVVEWASWWEKTTDRWKTEGLPGNCVTEWEIRDYFGLDRLNQCWVRPRIKNYPRQEEGKPAIITREDYKKYKAYLYQEEAFDVKLLESWGKEQKKGELSIWLTLEGFFWWPRILLGIENHLCAFYDNPELMNEINNDLLAHHKKVIKQMMNVCEPDFMTFAEDMSYNKGPMISEDMFNEFIAPFYKQIVPELKKNNIVTIVDTDGNIKDLVPWFLRTGVDGFLPLEKQAGVDIVSLRKIYPKIRFVGGFDKMIMHLGEKKLREEFERILPVMKQGGFIPSVDHQTPPAVSFENYKLYLKLLNEYCRKAV